MFFKRLSRSRSNSQSYVDNYTPHDSKTNSATYDDKYSVPEKYQQPQQSQQQQQQQQQQAVSSQRTSVDQHQPQAPPPRHSETAQHQVTDPAIAKESGMYGRTSQSQDVGAYDVSPQAAEAPAHHDSANGYGGSRDYSNPTHPAPSKHEAPPDLLLQAFNQALRPYNEKVDDLEREISDLRAYIDQLESQRGEVHAWIDKRGLRPDVPPSIAHQMDSASHESSPTHAAATLNAQLDRKITIVNFDLHRLQDDLNDSLPTPSFSACMLKFLPDIQRLSSLSSGPRYAFDLLLKLGGNLNSHGGLENGDEADLAERRSFYNRLDQAMVQVVRGRFREEGDGWGVQREIKRIEKTGAYLRNWGVEPYFPNTLDVMRENSAQHSNNATTTGGAAAATSPPTYS